MARETVRIADPEREMVRRAMPFGLPAFVLALFAGAWAGGWNVGWSAAIGVAVVFVNFLVHGLSLARAARISIVALQAVALVGFVVRLAAIVAILAALNRLAFFSPLAFGVAVVPSTILLLAYEMKLLGRGLGSELRLPVEGGTSR